MRQNSDPAIPSFFQDQPDRDVYDFTDYVRLTHANPPQALANHFMSSPVLSKEAFALFLADRAEMTVMMDMLPHGMPKEIPKQCRSMLNMEDVLVCVLPCRSCEDCPKEETRFGQTRANMPIYRRKNLCYYKLADAMNGNDVGLPSYVARQIVRPQS